jgi:cation diffusion facilitator family transporter
LSDALHALLDVGATTMTYFAVRVSAKPADDDHHYGHNKIEAVAALIETGLLFVVAIYVAFEAVGRLWSGTSELEPSRIAYIVLGVALVVDLVRSQSLLRIAKKTGSEALAADALHFTSDLVSTTLVLCGLVAAQYGYPQGDTIAAIGVAVFIVIAGYRLGKRTVNTLMDKVPAGLADTVRQQIIDVSGVVSVDSVKLRPDGNGYLAEIEIGVSRTLALDRVEGIKKGVVQAVEKDLPQSRVMVGAIPRILDDETILERVLHVARVMGHPIHHVIIQHIDAHTSVSLDLEVDGRLPLRKGHAIADQMEAAIMDELGMDVEVEIHLEPLNIQGFEGYDADVEKIAKITAALEARAAETKVAQDVHDVRVRETSAGLIVIYHCRIASEHSIATAHRHIDFIENALSLEFPDIARVVGHAEPIERDKTPKTP